MVSSRKSKAIPGWICATALLVTLSGCAEYINNWDTVSARAGNAHMANTAIQEIEPWPPAAYRTTVGNGG